MITIKDLYNYTVNANVNLLGNVSTFDFMKEYTENAEMLDFNINHDYENYVLLTSQKEVQSAYQEFVKLVKSHLLLNSYKYSGLYKTTLLEYNPIENYSMTEIGTDTRTPNITITDSTKIGEQSNNTTSTDSVSPYDTQTFTDSNKTIVSENNGARTDSNTRTESGTYTTSHEFKRTGNIGVTTSQQMRDSERKLVNFTFLKIVFNNIINDTCIVTEWGAC